MAVQRFRYRRTLPAELLKVQSQVGATLAQVGQTQGQIVDWDLDTAVNDIADLTDKMTKLGYALIEGPGVSGTPGDVAEFLRRSGDSMDSGANVTMVGGGTIKGLPAVAATDDEAISLAQLNAKVISGRIWREAILIQEQLLSGGSGGILQAIVSYVAATLSTTPADTYTIDDGTVTETWTAVAAAPAAFQFIGGVSAAADQAALVAAINNDSTLWSAVETSGLDDYFAGTPSTQFVVYRKATSSNADRVYGTLFAASSIKVAEFATGLQDYTSAAGTESDLPAADPSAKRFGFGRDFASLFTVETHFAVEDNSQWTWDEDDDLWQMTGGTGAISEPPLLWGAGDVASSITTRYLYPTYSDDLAQVDRIEWRFPRNGTIRKLRVRHNITGAAATVITYTFEVNATPTALSAGLAASGSDASDLSNSVVVSAGDLGSMVVTKAGSLAGVRPRDIIVSAEYA